MIEDIKTLIKAGKYFKAYDLAKQAIIEKPSNLAIKQLFAQTLIRLGVIEKAEEYLSELYFKQKERDPETSGLLGRVYKDLWLKSNNIEFARKSRDVYLKSYKESNDTYPGINAASMSFVINDKAIGAQIAKEIVSSLKEQNIDYWGKATIGEAFLLIGEKEKSIMSYKNALGIAGGNIADVNSSYRQLKILESYIDIPLDLLRLFAPPGIVFFSGHMIDRPERKKPRFTESIVNTIKEEIQIALEKMNAKIAYTSAACGADILFIEAMQERNAEINIFLPFQKEDFLVTSVSYAGKHWEERFENILRNYPVNYITEEAYMGDDKLFNLTGNIMMGLSIIRAKTFQTIPNFLAVLDCSEDKDLIGGTYSLLNQWFYKDSIYKIDTSKYHKQPTSNQIPENKQTQNKPIPFEIKREIKYILFADIVGFSKLHEEQTPYFMFELLKTISERLKILPVQPEVVNTWGDAIFVVYDTAPNLMKYAMVINDLLIKTDWTKKNLPKELNIRIALHVGPVFNGVDPITNKNNAYGSHINRAARMEPVTLPGCIFATEQFAAILAMQTGDEYTYRYVGILELPKSFGKQKTYHISKH